VESDVEVIVVDDGIGFDPLVTPTGRGTPSLRRRAALLGGSIHVDSAAGRGTRVSLSMPVCRSEVQLAAVDAQSVDPVSRAVSSSRVVPYGAANAFGRIVPARSADAVPFRARSI
jgi:hypothetical protein